jgi:hypothetical protein
MKKLTKTLHDVALGLFINGSFDMLIHKKFLFIDIYIVVGAILIMYLTNKGD